MNSICMYFIVIVSDLVKIAKLVEEKLIFDYIIYREIGDRTNIVCTWLIC
jgi:hypothetical protein